MASNTFLNMASLSDKNISLYFLPIVWMLGFVPHELKLFRLGTRYSNFKPRDPVEFRQGDSEKYKEHIEKLGSMHHNGVEAFPLFAATILAANIAHLPIPYLNSYALTYTLSRFVYNIVYYTQVGFFTDSVRTAIYVGGMFGNLWVLLQSANRLSA